MLFVFLCFVFACCSLRVAFCSWLLFLCFWSLVYMLYYCARSMQSVVLMFGRLSLPVACFFMCAFCFFGLVYMLYYCCIDGMLLLYLVDAMLLWYRWYAIVV